MKHKDCILIFLGRVFVRRTPTQQTGNVDCYQFVLIYNPFVYLKTSHRILCIGYRAVTFWPLSVVGIQAIRVESFYMRLLIEFFFTNHNSNFYRVFNGFLFAFYVIFTRVFYLQVIDFYRYRVYKRLHGTCVFIRSRIVNRAYRVWFH